MPRTPQLIEQELLPLIAAGDEVVFAVLFNNYRNKIYSIAYELTESTVIAEEIVPNTFLKIWLRRETPGAVTYFKACLFTITRNSVFSAQKRSARKQHLERRVAADTPVYDSDTENKRIQTESDERFKQPVNCLPANRYRSNNSNFL